MQKPLRTFSQLRSASTRLSHPTRFIAYHSRRTYSTRLAIPPDSWDSHVHVIDPKQYPISKTASYKAHAALLPDLLASARKLNVPNLVFVQVSTYGIDNSCQLSALKSVTPARGCAVVEFDPDTIDAATLQDWHDLGVRGVRINLKSVGRKVSQGELVKLVRKYDTAIKTVPTWAIDLHIALSAIPHLESIVPELAPRNIVIDHMGSPMRVQGDMDSVPGWTSLVNLLSKHDNVHVKISAPYRFVEKGEDCEFRSFEPLVKPLLRARGGKGVLWASDWPHTRYDGVNIGPWATRCLEWCGGDEQMVERLFRGNAREVWSVD